MRGLTRRLVAVAAVATSIVAIAPAAAQARPCPQRYTKVGYYTQWSIYARNYQLSKVQSSGQASRLTHLDYAFGPVTAGGVCASADPWADWQTPSTAELAVDGVA